MRLQYEELFYQIRVRCLLDEAHDCCHLIADVMLNI